MQIPGFSLHSLISARRSSLSRNSCHERPFGRPTRWCGNCSELGILIELALAQPAFASADASGIDCRNGARSRLSGAEEQARERKTDRAGLEGEREGQGRRNVAPLSSFPIPSALPLPSLTRLVKTQSPTQDDLETIPKGVHHSHVQKSTFSQPFKEK